MNFQAVNFQALLVFLGGGEGQKVKEKKFQFCLLKWEDHFFTSCMCEGISRLEMFCALYPSAASEKVGTGPRKIKVSPFPLLTY